MPFSDLPISLTILWLLWLFQAIVCAINACDFGLRIKRQERRYQRRVKRSGPFTPPVVIVVPVKGFHDRLRHHVNALANQDYPHYRVQYVVESLEDVAYSALQKLGCEVLVAGWSERGGQKVHNLLTALDSLQTTDEVVVFADADGTPSAQWLRRLIDPLRRPKIGATTTYRWLLPDKGLASAVMAVLNRSVGTLIGSGWRTFAWGGSTALRKEMIDEVKLRDYWSGALSDDFRLSAAVRKSGKKINSVPICSVVSPVTATWPSLWEFGRRQYLITRLHVPWIWWIGLLSTGLYTVSFACVAGLQFKGGASAEIGLVVALIIFALDALRAVMRSRGARNLLPADTPLTDRRTWYLELLCTPLWMTLHFLIILSSAFGRSITWAGITYDLRQPNDVRIVARS
jgi:hypothetical protein